MKKHSCGAILYTIKNNIVYIVLGLENGAWFPFKGTREKGETNVQAAIREINEETCGAVTTDSIKLRCNYSTKRKHYHIGLVKITSNEFKQFYINRNTIINNSHIKGYSINDSWHYLEKDDIKMFPINDIMKFNFHEITEIPIRYYYHQLVRIQKEIINKSIINNITQIPITSYKSHFIKKSPQCGPTKSSKPDSMSMILV